jgi:hypothetical protein
MESRAVVGHFGSPSLMPVSKKLILIATRARASGLSWTQTADLVKRTVPTIRNWRDRHKAEWDRCYEIAQLEAQNEAGAEAVGVLRHQMRNKDDIKIAHMAAKALLLWFSRPMARMAAAPPMDDASRVDRYQQGLDPEETHEIAHEAESFETDTQ